jgi:hypothetical protein
VQPHAGPVGDGEATRGQQRPDLVNGTGDGGAVNPIQRPQGLMGQLESQDHQSDEHPVTGDQPMGGAGPSGMPTRVAATLLQGTFVADGPWVGQLDDQLAKVLPGDPGEDWMSEGRVGACWRRHPCIIVRPPHFLNRGDRPDALLSTPAEAASW